ncbi:MAG: substrate-binding domain-containing protein [Oscillospiraceae bacterium]|nr:substrate-binding domain-containing protein [Oscillospiraceae bacterium]
MLLISLVFSCFFPKITLKPYNNSFNSQNFKVKSNGSTTMSQILYILGENFAKNDPEFIYEKNESGSGAAITSVISGDSDLGDISRELKQTEISENLGYITLATDGIILILNKKNPISNLTSRQVKDIYEGEIKNWSEINPEINLKITTIGRENASGTREGFEKTFKIKNSQYEIILPESGDILTKVSSEKSAIGYISFVSSADSVNTVKIDNIACNYESIKNGSYPATRPFIQVYNKNSKSIALKKWLDFLHSEHANEIIKREKLVDCN